MRFVPSLVPLEPLLASLPSVLPLVAPFAAPRAGARISVLPGEGIGPELFDVVRDALAATGAEPLELQVGGAIGREAEAVASAALTGEVTAFCKESFAAGAPVLCGPGAGRFVYDLRRRFDLFCKLVPIQPAPEPADAGCLRPEHRNGVDILVVRENVGASTRASRACWPTPSSGAPSTASSTRSVTCAASSRWRSRSRCAGAAGSTWSSSTTA